MSNGLRRQRDTPKASNCLPIAKGSVNTPNCTCGQTAGQRCACTAAGTRATVRYINSALRRKFHHCRNLHGKQGLDNSICGLIHVRYDARAHLPR
ncbi:hypothetical protein SERLADRAFT_471496 [Serpula lacrymans var. lacrymans S7.9]|uniref:Uncharacterized protein n=1 Tax=Serpula lacrymans var. lacrymans (strain S7.9) TaxID=578457 RepID=F8P1B9_SERL9|nr:uncharacterized protein SERLADRAFT_471496 [Serpula lacrymans var. lacrymans S7.9]EGO22948.1 hypothetical protein SERLADRAFT_471496 [Serpula lacrymans var. lacrymans S7.9]